MARKSLKFLAVSLFAAAVAPLFAQLHNEKAVIKNFEINEVFKSASAAYKCVGDTTFGDSVAVYTEVSANIQWPVKLGDLDITNLQDSLMARIFPCPQASIDESITRFIAQPFSYSEMPPVPVNYIPDLGPLSVAFFRHIDLKTIGFCEKFIVFKTFYSDFTGGAHGSHSSFFLNYDLVNNRILNFNDIFIDGCDDSLLAIIKQALCDKYYAKDFDALADVSGIFTNEIFVTHNVYLTGSNIVFYFNPYEIGPWCIGDIEVEIPVFELAQFFRPQVAALYSNL